MKERKFKYRWQRTYAGAVDDYSCWDGGECIGTVMLHKSGPTSFWAFYMSIDQADRPIVNVNGQGATRDDACHGLEAAYDLACENEKNARQP